jgi:peptide deformylase
MKSLFAVLLILQSSQYEALTTVARRDIVKTWLSLPFFSAYAACAQDDLRDFPYSSDWTGTRLDLMSLETAAKQSSWDMGRWPDPILRRSAKPVEEKWYETESLQRVAQLLTKAATDNKAVGLAAQQCGVDARMVYLESPRKNFVMINPSIVQRSPEADMKVWSEFCLVLPPKFRATVLRDAWIDVEYHDVYGTLHSTRLKGETARAAQHELDHDRGILTLDHIDLQEMENDVMRSIERQGHDGRQDLAFTRAVDDRSTI